MRWLTTEKECHPVWGVSKASFSILGIRNRWKVRRGSSWRRRTTKARMKPSSARWRRRLRRATSRRRRLHNPGASPAEMAVARVGRIAAKPDSKVPGTFSKPFSSSLWSSPWWSGWSSTPALLSIEFCKRPVDDRVRRACRLTFISVRKLNAYSLSTLIDQRSQNFRVGDIAVRPSRIRWLREFCNAETESWTKVRNEEATLFPGVEGVHGVVQNGCGEFCKNVQKYFPSE